MKLRNKRTGEVFNFAIKVEQDNTASYFILRTGSGGWEDGLTYGTLEELNAEWEDYSPAEPLIKDEKVRKAVRAWAEVNSIKEALYTVRMDGRLCVLTDMSNYDFSIEFVGWIPTLKDGETYTIAELCGEEEE